MFRQQPEPDDLDSTLESVEKIALKNGYDSFVMLNVYPQRATKPRNLHRDFDPKLEVENERHISAIVDGRDLTIWAAWGGLINKRRYLPPLLRDILELPALEASAWVSRGAVSKNGHPHHPLYVKDMSRSCLSRSSTMDDQHFGRRS